MFGHPQSTSLQPLATLARGQISFDSYVTRYDDRLTECGVHRFDQSVTGYYWSVAADYSDMLFRSPPCLHDACRNANGVDGVWRYMAEHGVPTR